MKVGEELTREILRADRWAWWFGLSLAKTPGCSCESLAAELDAWGPEECRLRFDDIVGTILQNARHVPLPEAIKRAGIRQLLTNAIARAEATL